MGHIYRQLCAVGGQHIQRSRDLTSQNCISDHFYSLSAAYQGSVVHLLFTAFPCTYSGLRYFLTIRLTCSYDLPLSKCWAKMLASFESFSRCCKNKNREGWISKDKILWPLLVKWPQKMWVFREHEGLFGTDTQYRARAPEGKHSWELCLQLTLQPAPTKLVGFCHLSLRPSSSCPLSYNFPSLARLLAQGKPLSLFSVSLLLFQLHNCSSSGFSASLFSPYA